MGFESDCVVHFDRQIIQIFLYDHSQVNGMDEKGNYFRNLRVMCL